MTFPFHWGVQIPVLCANMDSLLPILQRALSSWRPHYSWKRHPWDTVGEQWRPPPPPPRVIISPTKLPHRTEWRTYSTFCKACCSPPLSNKQYVFGVWRLNGSIANIQYVLLACQLFKEFTLHNSTWQNDSFKITDATTAVQLTGWCSVRFLISNICHHKFNVLRQQY